jgi:hypothetical protein
MDGASPSVSRGAVPPNARMWAGNRQHASIDVGVHVKHSRASPSAILSLPSRLLSKFSKAAVMADCSLLASVPHNARFLSRDAVSDMIPTANVDLRRASISSVERCLGACLATCGTGGTARSGAGAAGAAGAGDGSACADSDWLHDTPTISAQMKNNRMVPHFVYAHSNAPTGRSSLVEHASERCSRSLTTSACRRGSSLFTRASTPSNPPNMPAAVRARMARRGARVTVPTLQAQGATVNPRRE